MRPENNEIFVFYNIAAHCRNLNFDCKQKGMALILDGEKFTYDRLDKLPDDKKMERVKVVEVGDGTIFQEEHAYLSNIYPSKFTYEDEEFPSAKYAFRRRELSPVVIGNWPCA